MKRAQNTKRALYHFHIELENEFGDGSGSDQGSIDSDVEVIDQAEEDDSSDDETSSSDNSEEESDDGHESESANAALTDLESALAAALGTRKLNPDDVQNDVGRPGPTDGGRRAARHAQRSCSLWSWKHPLDRFVLRIRDLSPWHGALQRTRDVRRYRRRDDTTATSERTGGRRCREKRKLGTGQESGVRA